VKRFGISLASRACRHAIRIQRRRNAFAHELLANTVAFTGTHDNNTTNGWWSELRRTRSVATQPAIAKTLARVKSFLRTDAEEIHWPCIESVMESRLISPSFRCRMYSARRRGAHEFSRPASRELVVAFRKPRAFRPRS